MFDALKNKTVFSQKYHTDSASVIVSCYFNPFSSPYRLRAFEEFYFRIKHLNHQIIECVIAGTAPQLPENKNIKRIYTESLLWHKESLLNKIIAELPARFRYVFWADADIVFAENNWLPLAVKCLKNNNLVQPFEYAIHLGKDEDISTFSDEDVLSSPVPNSLNPRVWRSFAANYVSNDLWKSPHYGTHGHVGFVWGARREILDALPLFDHALIGGADHIIAHAAADPHLHTCIAKAFTENLEEIRLWSEKFYDLVQGKIAFVQGNLFHFWHGDLSKRQYYKRVREFTKTNINITRKDENGLFVTDKGEDAYLIDYFLHREETE